MKITLTTTALLCSAFFFISCKKTENTKASESSQDLALVTTTTGMVADITRQIGASKVKVTGLIGEGIDPHLYQPTRNDLVSLHQADIIFYNGLKLEGKMEDVLLKMEKGQKGENGKPVIAVTDGLAKQEGYLIGDPHHPDPHVWMDVEGWIQATETINQALSDFDPTNAESYHTNSKAYLQELEALQKYAVQSFATIPESQRVLVTAHDAFGYLGRAYGIEVRGIQGISTESEAGIKDIENLVDFLVEQKIPAVFVESSVSDQNVRALLEGAKARGHEVRIGGELFSDAMGAAGTYEGTYLGMIDHNVTTITRALGGEAPELGRLGKLSH